ncbi:hypothetical protein FRB99_002157, partial [Tulasnella sp. 403]
MLGGSAILGLVIFFIWKGKKKSVAEHPTPQAAAPYSPYTPQGWTGAQGPAGYAGRERETMQLGNLKPY